MALVLLHEAGHMVVAKWCGMRVERFSIFFGRPLWSFRRGETEYGIGWLPLGGYVKISGMMRGEEIPPEVEHRAYYNMPVWRRVVTILAGPAVNILLAVVIFAAIFWIGVQTFNATTTVDSVSSGSAAAAAGLRPGDQLLAIDGVRANGDTQILRDQLGSKRAGDDVVVTVDRDGTIMRKQATLQEIPDGLGGTRAGLGVNFRLVEGPTQRYGFIGGIDQGLDFTWFVVKANGQVFGDVFTS